MDTTAVRAACLRCGKAIRGRQSLAMMLCPACRKDLEPWQWGSTVAKAMAALDEVLRRVQELPPDAAHLFERHEMVLTAGLMRRAKELVCRLEALGPDRVVDAE